MGCVRTLQPRHRLWLLLSLSSTTSRVRQHPVNEYTYRSAVLSFYPTSATRSEGASYKLPQEYWEAFVAVCSTPCKFWVFPQLTKIYILGIESKEPSNSVPLQSIRPVTRKYIEVLFSVYFRLLSSWKCTYLFSIENFDHPADYLQ